MICERCGHKLLHGPAQLAHGSEQYIANLRADLAAREADRIHLNALLGWIEALIGGDVVSDFAQSFPLVRAVCDLVRDRGAARR